ncbi:MAG TPA: hypothetical protein ENK18_09945 [Deltaproteobacteria bacterium]|nr:hypothetical protein [Deltaproteobacteria bacterium]
MLRDLVHPLLWSSVLWSGCGGPEGSGPPTWHGDVAPIVIERCSGCHNTGGIAPFPLETHAQASDFADAILGSIEDGSMPPFLAQETDACRPRLPWAHDLRLSESDKQLLRGWVEAGTPEGDPATASPVDPPEQLQLERADVVLTLPEPVTVEGTADVHTCVVLDPGLLEDSFVTGRQIVAGNPKVLHHVVSYTLLPGVDEEGQPRSKEQLEAALIAERGVGIGGSYDCFGGPGLETIEAEMLDAWAPGGRPNLAPPNSGQPLSKDALVLLDIHYHPTGLGPETDAGTTLSLMLADAPPELISQTILLGNFSERFESPFGIGDLLMQPGEREPSFSIPAGAQEHVEEMTWEWILLPGFDLSVYGMGTHMHYVGRDMSVTLERAAPLPGEPGSECLIQTPAWDFNWQRGYEYDAPFEELPVMRNGDVVRMRCVFDNSMSNGFVVDALSEQGLSEPVEVGLGEDTLDEMCLAAIAIVYPNFPVP